MRLSLWGLAMIVLGIAGVVFAGGNFILVGFSGFLILVGFGVHALVIVRDSLTLLGLLFARLN